MSKYKKPAALAALVLLTALLVPILWAGRYAHPFGDDYAFGIYLHDALQSGTSPIGALLFAVRKYYFGWQGTFSGIIAMGLMPDAILPGSYPVTPWIVTFLLLGSTAKLLHTLLCRKCKGDFGDFLLCWALVCAITLWGLPSPAEGLYWFNGAIYYTGFFCTLLLLVDRLVNLWKAPRDRAYWLRVAQAALLCVWVSGGNYVSALLSVCLLALYLLCTLLWDRRAWPERAALLLLGAGGLLISALAPGNAVRQSAAPPMGVADTVLISIKQGAMDAVGFTTPALLVGLLVLAPVLWRLAGNVDFSFPLPGCAAGLAFLLFCAQNAPHFRALSEAGPGRLRDIVFASWPWFLGFTLFYFIGWLRRRWTPPKTMARLWAPLGAALLVLALVQGFPLSTAGQVTAALRDGSLRAYHESLAAREELYRDNAVTQVVYDPVPCYPPLFRVYFFDYEDPEVFSNVAPRNYFHKDAVYQAPQN